MGEEKKGKGKKKKGGEKKQEEEKKVEVVITEKKEEDAKPEAAAAVKEVEKPKEEEKKSEGGDGKKDSKETAPPPPPPPEIVLRVFMHCEGCARKVRKCLKGFDGVVDVTTDCKTHKVVVTGEKADPLKVLDRLQKKTHRQVDLLSPVPPPPVEEAKKPEEKEAPKPEPKKEPKVITVVLKVHMHCEACSLEIKRRIERMKEVEEAIPDLKSSQVTVKGTFEPPKLVEYVYKRTGKHATIVKEDPPPPEKKEDDKAKDGKEEGKKAGKEEKKAGNGDKAKKGEGKAEETKGEQKEVAAKAEEGKAAPEEGGPATAEEGAKVVELKTNEFQYYPPRYAMEMHAYPPQIFSDENPNACSIM